MGERVPFGGWPLSAEFVGPLPRCACGYSPLVCKGGVACAARVEWRKRPSLEVFFGEVGEEHPEGAVDGQSEAVGASPAGDGEVCGVRGPGVARSAGEPEPEERQVVPDQAA